MLLMSAVGQLLYMGMEIVKCHDSCELKEVICTITNCESKGSLTNIFYTM